MPSRQDQLHSYQFMVQRVVSALVLRETDPPQSPFRRAAGAAFASVLVAVVIAAGFGVYAIFTGGGNTKWTSEGAVVVEKETGAAFLFHQGKLHPALNVTSAMLASNQPKPVVHRVASRSLRNAAPGPMIGIPYLPNSIADRKQLIHWPWSVCAFNGKNGPVSAVIVGDEQVIQGRLVAATDAMMVKASTKSATITYMLWRGRLYEVKPNVVEQLAGGVQATVVVPAFANGLPRGEPIEQINVTNRGKLFSTTELWKIGEVIRVQNLGNVDQYVLVLENGLFRVTQFQAQLLDNYDRRATTNELTAGGRKILDDLLPKSNDLRQPPRELPTFKTFTGTSLCSVILDEAGNTELRADVPLDLEKRTQTARRSSNATPYADYVVIPHGRAAIVANGQTLSYVSRDGVRFAAANSGVLAKLGYENVNPVKLQASLVALLPEGPGLDPEAAMQPVTVS